MGELDDLQDPVEETETPESEGQTDEQTVLEDEQAVVKEAPESTEPEKKEPENVPYSRFAEVYGKSKKYERDAEYWREQAMKTQPKIETDNFEKQEPKFDDFDDIGEFTKAVTRWEREKWEFEKSQEERQRQAQTMQMTFDEKIAKGDEKYPDFREKAFLPKINGKEQTFEAMVQVLTESDHAADIVYFFGQNQQEALRIASLSPAQAGREIGRLEFKMTETPKKVTDPPKTTSPGSGTEPPPIKDEESMTMEEWESRWEKGELPGSPAQK